MSFSVLCANEQPHAAHDVSATLETTCPGWLMGNLNPPIAECGKTEAHPSHLMHSTMTLPCVGVSE